MNDLIQVEFNEQAAPLGFEVARIEQKQSEFGDVMQKPGRHFFFMIMYITNGNGSHEIDFKKHKVQQGDLIFLAKGQVQAFEQNSELKGFALLFTEEFLTKYSGQSSIMAEHRLFNYHLNKPVLHLNSNQKKEEFKSLFSLIEKEFYATEDTRKMEVLYHYLQILMLKADELHGARLSAPLSNIDYVQFTKLKNLVAQKLKETRSVSFYANELGLSTKKLNQLTKKVTGKNAKDYLIELTILEIKRILVSTQKSVQEVSFEIGFEEPTNMVKFFKRSTGFTPREFVGAVKR
ncbi:MAG: AraC family transcriptional regulator [Bacteroidia bacterium]